MEIWNRTTKPVYKFLMFPLVVQNKSKYYQGSAAETAMQTYKETPLNVEDLRVFP